MVQLSEKVADILECLPEAPKRNEPNACLGWTWHAVQIIKDIVSKQYNYGSEPWHPNDVRQAFMHKLFRARLPSNERKMLVEEFNRALGKCRFPKDWPTTVCYIVDMLEPLPPVDRIISPSPKPSQALQRLIAALYIVGTHDDRFMFAMNVYAKLMGCSAKTLCKFINRLCSLGYLEKVRQGYSSHEGKGKGKGTWYRLDNPHALLNLFQFTTAQDQSEFVRKSASVHRQMDEVPWGDYVITPQWLYDNRLLSARHYHWQKNEGNKNMYILY